MAVVVGAAPVPIASPVVSSVVSPAVSPLVSPALTTTIVGSPAVAPVATVAAVPAVYANHGKIAYERKSSNGVEVFAFTQAGRTYPVIMYQDGNSANTFHWLLEIYSARVPDKLLAMFVGYHKPRPSRTFVEMALIARPHDEIMPELAWDMLFKFNVLRFHGRYVYVANEIAHEPLAFTHLFAPCGIAACGKKQEGFQALRRVKD